MHCVTKLFLLYILLLLNIPLPSPAFKTKLKPLVPASCQSEISKKLFCSSPVNLSHLSLAGQQSGQRVSGPGNPVGAEPKVALGGS